MSYRLDAIGWAAEACSPPRTSAVPKERDPCRCWSLKFGTVQVGRITWRVVVIVADITASVPLLLHGLDAILAIPRSSTNVHFPDISNIPTSTSVINTTNSSLTCS